MVFSSNATNDKTSRKQPEAPVSDTVIGLEQMLGQVSGSSDRTAFGEFFEVTNFYFAGSSSLATRRNGLYPITALLTSPAGAFSYRGDNPGVVTVNIDGSVSIWRNNFATQQTFPAKTILFENNAFPLCSFCAYGSSVFLATGAGLYEMDFSSGLTVLLSDVSCWMCDYAVGVDTGANLNLIAIGDVLSLTPPSTILNGRPVILYVRAIRGAATPQNTMSLWVTGSELKYAIDLSTFTVIGKATVTGKIRLPAGQISFIEAAGRRPVKDQTYGIPKCVAERLTRFYVATTKNYLGLSFPGVPENWNLTTTNGAQMIPVLARSALTPTQLLDCQEGLLLGLSNPNDPNDGQLFLLGSADNTLVKILNDVGPLPGTMLSVLQTTYFLSGRGIHPVDITAVREQLETKTASGQIRELFQTDPPLPGYRSFAIYDNQTGQVWFSYSTRSGPKFMNMEPLVTTDSSSSLGANRFSFFDINATFCAEGVSTPYLLVADAGAVGKTTLAQLSSYGGYDQYTLARKVAIRGRLITGPATFSVPGNVALLKDCYLAAHNLRAGKLRMAILVDTTNKNFATSSVIISGTDSAQEVYQNAVMVDVYAGEENRLFEADPFFLARGIRFRVLIEDAAVNPAWELVALSVRGLTGGYRRSIG